jgi:FkbH-like protein
VGLVRPEDLPGESEEERRQAASQLLDAIAKFVAETRSTLLVSDLPPVLSKPASSDDDELRLWWRRELETTKGVEVLGFSEIVEEIGKVAARDLQMEVAASAPFSAVVYQRLGMGIARAVRRLRIPPKKVIAMDCDGTLWGGVVGEDGREGIQLGDDMASRGHLALQRELLSLERRGVLLVLASRNLPEDVWGVVDEHPSMLIRRKDIAAARINWKPKSANLRELASELKLGLDSFVFLDDNPVERLEVENNCPGVTVVPLPTEATEFAGVMSRLWLFDGAGATQEDHHRQEFVRQERDRQTLKISANGLESYLSSLELKARLWRAREEDLERVSQLTQKTNQFNLSLKRRSLPEIRALSPEYEIRVISAADRYGDYGMIGVAISRREQEAVVLDSLLVSCRALGRGVEEAFLYGLLAQARSNGAKVMRAPFVDGPRNQPMKDFLARNGFKANGGLGYELELPEHSTAPRHLKLELAS